MTVSWTAYVIGPLYTLLPRRWRAGTGHSSERSLVRATMISGVSEALVALFVLSFWYMYYFGTLGTKYSAFNAGSSHFAFPSTELAGDAEFITFAVNPLTWAIVYFGIEGILRTVGALITGETVGTLPLYGLEYAWRTVQRKRAAPELPLVTDEITPGREICDIRIASCRQRDGWRYPFTLRYAGAYFQVIDEQNMGVGPRPYVYSLRRLPAGEVARGLKNYDPTDVLRPIERIQPI
jgi:hypothetical protein